MKRGLVQLVRTVTSCARPLPLRGCCDGKTSESTVTEVQRATLDDHDDIVPHSAVIRINRNDDPDGGLWVSTGRSEHPD